MLELETERLRFRQWRIEDFNTIATHFADEEWAKYVGGKKTPEESWRLLATYIGHIILRGYGFPAIETKAGQHFVGTVGLWDSDPWPETELGYWLLPEAQGSGYAIEAARSVLGYAFGKLEMETVVSYIDAANGPSIRLAEKLGGYDDGELELLDYGPHRIYRYLPDVIDSLSE